MMSASVASKLERFFGVAESGSTLRRELIGGLTTFLTLSYIILVQPAVLASTGMDPGAVMVATCLSSAVATLLMGFWAKYPIALAPAMGHNFYFAFAVCLGIGIPWQQALGAVFISGTLFTLVSPFGFREGVMKSLPDSLKYAIAGGIGLMISLIGCEWGGLVVPTPPYSTFITMGNLGSKPAIVCLLGLLTIGVCMALRIRGGIVFGMVVSTVVAWLMGLVEYHGIVSKPPSLSPTLFQLDIAGAFSRGFVTIIFTFFILDLFDTIGTLVGVGEAGGLMKNGKLPRASRALCSDAVGTVAGAVLGTSTVTSYVESAAGIAEGARTGLANVVTAVLFLAALFFYPLVQMVGEPHQLVVSNDITITVRPILAPAILYVGLFMIGVIKRIDWDDITEALPAFLTMIFMPFGGMSITDGIGFGFISYTLLKLITGRFREVHPLLAGFAVVFVLKYIVNAT